MKAYVSDFNNVLTELRQRVNLTTNPREADVIILWQDVRGYCRTLCEINRDYMNKPVVVVQHGRGATRDYLEPNNFKMLADKFCVWGAAEAERLQKAGYGDRAVITGSPLVSYTRRPRQERQQKAKGKRIIVFTPIIASHEEVMNIEVALELRKIEYTIAQETLHKHKDNLKAMWHSWVIDETVATENEIPYEILHKDWYPIYKLTDIHDFKLYHGEHIKTTVMHSKHLETSMIILNNCECVVGLEEGTFQLMATAMGIPTVIVDGFKYESYGGVDGYDKMEVINTPATAHCTIDSLRSTIEAEMNNPDTRKDAREGVIRNEFDPYPDKDPIELIIDVACNLAQGEIRLSQLVEA